MSSNDRVRIEISFDGGGVMLATVHASSLEQLELALSGPGGGAVSLDAEDGLYTVAVGKIVYVKRFSRESRVGFGHS